MIDDLATTSGLTRRQVLKGLAAIGLVPTVLGGCTPIIDELIEAIANRPTRRNVANLASDDDILEAYRDAITQMKALPSTDKRSWERQADIHDDRCPHSNWLFLPWHRQYLYWFERIVRDLSGMDDWALPYWNWIEDPTIPAPFLSGVLSHPRDGTTTSISPTVADAAMAHTAFVNFGSGALAAGEFQRPATSKTKSDFERDVHDAVHVDLGNFTNGMGSFRSPLDPIFWLHHNMVEYMWVEWNLGRGNLNPSDAHWGDYEFSGDFADTTGADVTGVSSSVAWANLYPLLAYQFENSAVGTVNGTV